MSSLCGYSDAYMLVKGTIKITGNAGPPAGRTDAQILNTFLIFKNCALFTECSNTN